MILAAFIFLTCSELIISQNVPNNGKKYYFKMGKNNSDFRVHNRIFYLNHNISDYDYPNRKVESVSVLDNEEKVSKTSLRFLDEDWNYHHENLTKTAFPGFIQKFYEDAVEDLSSSNINKRILFNTNRISSSSIFSFNLDSLDPNEPVLDADLYFYWPLSNMSSIFKESVVLRLYQFERQFNENLNETNLIQNPDIHKLFNVIYVSKAQKGWQIFKVRKPIDNWLTGEENLGLLLTISSYDDNKLIEVFNDTNDGVFSTFIVVKVQNNNTLPIETDPISSNRDDSARCQRKEWAVNFASLGWDQFIISPKGFIAYDCAGKCSRPHDEDTNHIKLIQILQKRSPCCVPVEYRSQPIMYVDKYDNIAIKNYNNLVVNECGCR